MSQWGSCSKCGHTIYYEDYRFEIGEYVLCYDCFQELEDLVERWIQSGRG